MNRPRTTVVIPFVNHAKFLPACFENIMRQDDPDFEIIFVDNGSADGSAALVAAFASQHPANVRCISEPRKGIPFARNCGLFAAKGSYVSFLDADDHFEPDKLRLLAGILDQQPDVAWVFGKTKRIYVESGKTVIQDTGAAIPGINQPPALALDWAASFYRLPQTGATLIRTHVAKAAGGFPEHQLLGNDDVAFHIRLALENKTWYHPEVTVNYYRHPVSEGARLNEAVSVHARYLDAHLNGLLPIAEAYEKQTGDSRLAGIVQKGIFANYVKTMRGSEGHAGRVTEKLWPLYRGLIPLYRVLPFGAAQFCYKVVRRMAAMVAPQRYPFAAA